MTTTERPVYAIDTPPATPGPIAVIRLCGPELEAACARLGLSPPSATGARVGSILGVDEGVIVRWSRARIDLMPHGGVAVVRAIAAKLEAAGFGRESPSDAMAAYPEAADEAEARMLAALSRAPSPRAIDLLLDQPARWRARSPGEGLADERLGRLLHPPLVAAIGAANIGKSALLNALAGRSVALVADHPGTTRDAVGALLELDGLVVRYADLPGIGAGGEESPQAEAAARAVLASADLALWCRDGTAEPAAVAQLAAVGGMPAELVRVVTRADRGVSAEASAWGQVRTSATTGEGLADLARAVRERLVPDIVLADPRPWRFWQAGGSTIPTQDALRTGEEG